MRPEFTDNTLSDRAAHRKGLGFYLVVHRLRQVADEKINFALLGFLFLLLMVALNQPVDGAVFPQFEIFFGPHESVGTILPAEAGFREVAGELSTSEAGIADAIGVFADRQGFSQILSQALVVGTVDSSPGGALPCAIGLDVVRGHLFFSFRVWVIMMITPIITYPSTLLV